MNANNLLDRNTAEDRKEEIQISLDSLTNQVWPVLALIGGVDRGLRMGGRCRSKVTCRTGTLLGVLKDGSQSVKVLWDDSDALIRYARSLLIFY